jgi:hypothetical protein
VVFPPLGIFAVHAYSLCVWPVKMAETLGLVCYTIFLNAPPAASSCFSEAPSGVPSEAPS